MEDIIYVCKKCNNSSIKMNIEMKICCYDDANLVEYTEKNYKILFILKNYSIFLFIKL